jgi:hypothetical protein
MVGVQGKAFTLGVLGIGAAGCADEDIAPPELVSAEIIEPGDVLLGIPARVRLHFSEPIAPVDQVDPLQFRLGVAFVGDSETLYYDLSHHFLDGAPQPRHAQTFVVGLERGDDESVLDLELSYVLDEHTCEIIEEARANGIPSEIHMHYRDAEEGVTDLAGNRLAGIGPWWAETIAFFGESEGSLDALDPAIPVACP